MPYKVVMSFRYFKIGWAELLYWPSDGLPDDTIVNTLVLARRGCLTSNCQLEYVRISNVDNARDAKFASFLGDAGAGLARNKAGTGAGEAEPGMLAYNFRTFAGVNTWRSYLVRGVADEALDSTGNPKAASRWLDAARTYFVTLATRGFSLRKSAVTTWTNIVSVDASSNVLRSVTPFAAVPDIAPGKVVRIRRLEGISNANGNWVVQSVTPVTNVVNLKKKLRANYGSGVNNTGQIGVVTYTYPAITEAVPVGMTKRDTGRPSYLPRGRRSVQRS